VNFSQTMRALFILLIAALPLTSHAAPKRVKAAVPAVPATPSVTAKPAGALIDSDLNGREMTFLSSAIGLGKTFRYLASQAPRTANPALRGFGDDLVKTLSAQSAVLNTVAGMRNLKIPDAQDAAERRLAAKLEKLEDIKLEKMLLDSFREADRQAIAIYEMGVKSDDLTIRNLSEQTLPQLREHLLIVEAMTGIAPKRTAPPSPIAEEPPASLEPAAPMPLAADPETNALIPELPPIGAGPRRPSFRANVHRPGESPPKRRR
jgi:hypothetical protein